MHDIHHLRCSNVVCQKSLYLFRCIFTGLVDLFIVHARSLVHSTSLLVPDLDQSICESHI